MRFGTWNVRSLYSAGSIIAAARDLVGLQEVRWNREGTVKAGDCNFFYAKEMKKPSIGNRIFCAQKNKISS